MTAQAMRERAVAAARQIVRADNAREILCQQATYRPAQFTQKDLDAAEQQVDRLIHDFAVRVTA